MQEQVTTNNNLQDLDVLDDERKQRYNPGEPNQHAFRNYDAPQRDTVKEFYRLNHRYQTLEFVLDKKRTFLPPLNKQMSIWEAMETLNQLVDDSDPDTDATQIEHLLQTAESIRHDGHPRWFILAGLIHDLGKLLCLQGEPQWAVVGDTFPVGCRYSPSVVYYDFFQDNPDWNVKEYQTVNGIYEDGCGLDNVHISWGHDEYLYQVVKDFLPDEALYMIRYHSCYAIHKEGAYTNLMNSKDNQLFEWVRAFNPYDLYSKTDTRPNVDELRPYYEELIREYFPPVISW